MNPAGSWLLVLGSWLLAGKLAVEEPVGLMRPERPGRVKEARRSTRAKGHTYTHTHHLDRQTGRRMHIQQSGGKVEAPDHSGH